MMRGRRRTTVIVLAPIVSILTLMLGLEIGAGHSVRSASVFVAPPGRPHAPGAPIPLAWQVQTYQETRGVRETIAMQGITVVAKSKGKESRFHGASNEDGILEASLALSELASGDPIEVEVRVPNETEPLARGEIPWRSPAWARATDEAAGRTFLRSSKREGPIGLDVLVEGERLVVGEGTTLWVRVVPAQASPISLHLTPEAGLRVAKNDIALTCDGWARIEAFAEGHVVGLQIDATDTGGRHGVWYGALPVAPGAFFVDAPRSVREGVATTVTLLAPNPRHVVYAEVDDEHGRGFASALPLIATPDAPIPRARFEMPALAPGLHWIVVSGEPHGAEHLSGATIAKPFIVGSAAEGGGNVDHDEPCSIGPWLAGQHAVGFPRWLAVDGMATRSAPNRTRHRVGLVIGLASLFVAAVLEALLLTTAWREARVAMRLAHLDETESERVRMTARATGGSLAIALLVALLGFALLAALMIANG